MSSRPSDFMLTAPGSLRLFSTVELLKLPPPEWLIDHVLPEGGLAVLYGPPGAGKTFAALDLILHLATGFEWYGHDTRRCLPLYVSAEGGAGISKRVGAWLKHHNVAPMHADVMWLLDTLPLYTGSSEVDRLMERIDEVDRVPGIIVVDTLARCFDGDENQQLDMGRFVSGVDHLRQQFKCTVLVVHHTRLDGDRERGNTALRGAADTMIEIEGGITSPHFSIKCSKQKDGANFDTLDLQRVMMPEFDSCVVSDETKDIQSQIVAVLKKANSPMRAKPLIDELVSLGLRRATIFRHLRDTCEKGKIIKENGEYRVSPTKLVSR